MSSPTPFDIRELVDHERGLVSRAVFVESEVYALEQQQIFGRSWLYLAHESQVSQAGDFILARMGEDSVILCHAPNGKLSAFVNMCPGCTSLLSRADSS